MALTRLYLSGSLLGAALLLAPAGSGHPPGPTWELFPKPADIVERLKEANQEREQRLAGYEVRRRYHLRNEIMEDDEVTLTVDVTFHAPETLKFETRSRAGSGFLAKQVFGRMMEGERKSLQPGNKRRSAMTPENYEFTLLGEETVRGRPAYKLRVTPKRKDTFLFEGTVWVDAQDWAVARAEGRVVKRPSFWTRKIEFARTFKKVGPFWLPDRTEGTTEVLLFGTSWTTIENGDYRVRVKAGSASSHAQR